ncbi:MAG: isopentenyl phosphate kinase family protein [Anaerolineae bacterium]|nr:isopentenyl phosphate kinase family protein [Anaerolineae bacterium]
MSAELVFVKLGGSLITDKQREATPRPQVIRRLAQEMKSALASNPGLRIVLGHGSGSFGHWAAKRHPLSASPQAEVSWAGFAQIGAAAARLNRLVTDVFLAEGVPVFSLPPSAAVLARAGQISEWQLAPLRYALKTKLIPLIFGDVAFDTERGGTILSTEDLFVHWAPILQPKRVLLLGNAPGVLDDQHRLIPTITPANYPVVAQFLRGSGCVDVTGGMADKVEQMLALVQRLPDLRAWIFTGREPGNLVRALLEPESTPGTLIQVKA